MRAQSSNARRCSSGVRTSKSSPFDCGCCCCWTMDCSISLSACSARFVHAIARRSRNPRISGSAAANDIFKQSAALRRYASADIDLNSFWGALPRRGKRTAPKSVPVSGFRPTHPAPRGGDGTKPGSLPSSTRLLSEAHPRRTDRGNTRPVRVGAPIAAITPFFRTNVELV